MKMPLRYGIETLLKRKGEIDYGRPTTKEIDAARKDLEAARWLADAIELLLRIELARQRGKEAEP